MRRAILIANPIAGRSRHGLTRARCVAVMAELGLEADVLETTGPNQVARLVADYGRNDFELLVAAGGAGTVREVAETASWLDLPVAIIPLGTSNSVARELGIPGRPAEAARVAATGRPRRVDMAETSGRRFLLCLGVGFDAEVVTRVHASRRRGIHMAAYVPAGLGALFGYTFPPIEVNVDGVAAPAGAVQVVVSNTRTWGGPFVLARDARIDDGWLDVCLFYGGRLSLAVQALRAALKRPLAVRPDRSGASGAVVLRAREVFIPGPPSAPVEMDGDPGPTLPLHLKVLPGAVRVIAPAEAGNAGPGAQPATPAS